MRRSSGAHGVAALLLLASVSRGLRAETDHAATPAPAPLADAVAAPPSVPATTSKAQDGPTLFKEGKELARRGDWDGACARFQASLSAEFGIGTEYNLADCLEHRGRTASARSLFVDVAERAQAEKQPDRERVARARAARLEGAVPSISIRVDFPSRGQEVRRDGTLLPAAAWGAALAIDPGATVIAATAPGKQPWSTRIDVPASGAVVAVLVPRLGDERADEKADEKAAAEAAPEAGTDEAKGTPTKEESISTSEVATEPSKGPSPLIPIVLLGGAGLGLLVGATSVVLYKRSNNEALRVCPLSSNCTQEQIARHDGLVSDARTMRTVGYVGFGVAGGALVTAGILALVNRNREASSPPSVSASPYVGPEGFGGAVHGRF